VGTIPIVMADSLTPLYNQLPVLVLNTLAELTPARVAEAYDDLSHPKALSTYDWHRTTAFYWLQQVILDTRRKREVMQAIMGGVYKR
jgi:hypothetical protein